MSSSQKTNPWSEKEVRLIERVADDLHRKAVRVRNLKEEDKDVLENLKQSLPNRKPVAILRKLRKLVAYKVYGQAEVKKHNKKVKPSPKKGVPKTSTPVNKWTPAEMSEIEEFVDLMLSRKIDNMKDLEENHKMMVKKLEAKLQPRSVKAILRKVSRVFGMKNYGKERYLERKQELKKSTPKKNQHSEALKKHQGVMSPQQSGVMAPQTSRMTSGGPSRTASRQPSGMPSRQQSSNPF